MLEFNSLVSSSRQCNFLLSAESPNEITKYNASVVSSYRRCDNGLPFPIVMTPAILCPRPFFSEKREPFGGQLTWPPSTGKSNRLSLRANRQSRDIPAELAHAFPRSLSNSKTATRATLPSLLRHTMAVSRFLKLSPTSFMIGRQLLQPSRGADDQNDRDRPRPSRPASRGRR